jgi:hypothetical protein
VHKITKEITAPLSTLVLPALSSEKTLALGTKSRRTPASVLTFATVAHAKTGAGTGQGQHPTRRGNTDARGEEIDIAAHGCLCTSFVVVVERERDWSLGLRLHVAQEGLDGGVRVRKLVLSQARPLGSGSRSELVKEN